MLFSSWYGLLKPILTSKYFSDLIKELNILYKSKNIFPAKKDVFKTFRLTDCKELSVVIVSQNLEMDYKDNGLLFGNFNGFADTFIIRKIKESIENSYCNGFNLNIDNNFDKTLESWAKQGVLLLNTSLTIDCKDNKKHINKWEDFIKFTLTAINDLKSDIVYVLIGEEAQKYESFISIDRNYILKTEHPSEQIKIERKWNFDFKGIDNLTNKINNKVIKWQNIN